MEIKKKIIKELKASIESDDFKKPASRLVCKLKGSIRKGESYGATRYIGIPDSQVHFMNLPFYETGTIKKNPISYKDIEKTIKLIETIKPHQIYAAGDLADPHGTHKVCLDIIFEALKQLKTKKFMNDCWVWLYRGAWHEWEIHEIEMAVPMSPDQVLKSVKRSFIINPKKMELCFKGMITENFGFVLKNVMQKLQISTRKWV